MKIRNILSSFLLISSIVLSCFAQNNPEFEKAKINAKEILPYEIKPVIAIRAGNPNIEWLDGKVVVLSFRRDCSKLEVGSRKDFGYSWVTVSPELKKRYEQNKSDFGIDKLRRVRQMLGLKPDNNYQCFVKIAVDPKNLWRPSFNNSVESDCLSLIPSKIDDDYKKYLDVFKGWLGDEYPFTALGYTCDWKNGACDYGLSEFVFKPQATGEIVEIFKTADDYLK